MTKLDDFRAGYKWFSTHPKTPPSGEHSQAFRDGINAAMELRSKLDEEMELSMAQYQAFILSEEGCWVAYRSGLCHRGGFPRRASACSSSATRSEARKARSEARKAKYRASGRHNFSSCTPCSSGLGSCHLRIDGSARNAFVAALASERDPQCRKKKFSRRAFEMASQYDWRSLVVLIDDHKVEEDERVLAALALGHCASARWFEQEGDELIGHIKSLVTDESLREFLTDGEHKGSDAVQKSLINSLCRIFTKESKAAIGFLADVSSLTDEVRKAAREALQIDQWVDWGIPVCVRYGNSFEDLDSLQNEIGQCVHFDGGCAEFLFLSGESAAAALVVIGKRGLEVKVGEEIGVVDESREQLHRDAYRILHGRERPRPRHVKRKTSRNRTHKVHDCSYPTTWSGQCAYGGRCGVGECQWKNGW